MKVLLFIYLVMMSMARLQNMVKSDVNILATVNPKDKTDFY